MDCQTISRVGTQLGAVLVIATAAQTATAQTVPAFCTSVENKALYSFSVAVGERLAEQFIDDATAGTDVLSCAQLVTVFLKFDDFVREFRQPTCAGAGLRDGGEPIIDTAACSEPSAESNLVEHPGGAFASNAALEELRGVTVVTGDLTLRDEVSDLSALSSLEAVRGTLRVLDNAALTSLDGLESLETVGDLFVITNPALTSLTGLESLTTVGDRLTVIGNPALTSLTGLESLTSVGDGLRVRDNPSLTSLTGVDSLTDVGGLLTVESNPSLTSLTGLDSLTSVGGFLGVSFNDALTSLTGLDSLTSVGGSLDVEFNPALTNLTGLDSLTDVEGTLLVRSNDAMTSLTGLEALTSVGGSLFVIDNSGLTSLTGLPPQFHGRVRGF